MQGAYDAVIVGSGFGGGVAACRLAAQGWRVCVLERGRRFAGEDFPKEPIDAPAALWHPVANPRGLFDVRMMRDLAVVTAAGVGGGSLVYANVQLRAPADVFAQGWPEAITRAELDPWYDRTEEALEPRTTPAQPSLAKVRGFDAMASRAGRVGERLPVAVHFGEARENPFGGTPQSGCENLGRCVLGCPVGAKNSVDLTYLARAERDSAEVRPLHEVLRIEPPDGNDGYWRVGYRQLGGGERGSVHGRVLVLAGGTLGSTRLLLSNRRRLRRLSPALGEHFSGNGDALGMAFNPTAPGTRGAREDIGPTMTSYIDYIAERRLIVADGGLPQTWSSVFNIIRGYNTITGWGRARLRLRNLGARLGFTDTSMRPNELQLGAGEPVTDSFVFMIFGRDAANGRVRLTPLLHRLDVRWNRAASEKLFEDMHRTTEELARAAGAEPFFALDAGPLSKFVTVHPLGGCPMSDDPQRGVVDHLGRVHGYRNLLVIDGSVIPTALGVNPSKTIAALAERSVAGLMEEQSP